MAERIVQFEQERIGLGRMVDDLDALLCALDSPDANWKAAFRKNWGVLEEVRAVALDNDLKRIPPDYQTLIDNAINEMKQLLRGIRQKTEKRVLRQILRKLGYNWEALEE